MRSLCRRRPKHRIFRSSLGPRMPLKRASSQFEESSLSISHTNDDKPTHFVHWFFALRNFEFANLYGLPNRKEFASICSTTAAATPPKILQSKAHRLSVSLSSPSSPSSSSSIRRERKKIQIWMRKFTLHRIRIHYSLTSLAHTHKIRIISITTPNAAMQWNFLCQFSCEVFVYILAFTEIRQKW